MSYVNASVDDVVQAPVIEADYNIEGENSYSILNSIKHDFELSSLPLKKSKIFYLNDGVNNLYNFELPLVAINKELVINNIDNKSSYIAWEFNPRAP